MNKLRHDRFFGNTGIQSSSTEIQVLSSCRNTPHHFFSQILIAFCHDQHGMSSMKE